MHNQSNPMRAGSGVSLHLLQFFTILSLFIAGLNCKKLDLPQVSTVTIAGIVQLPSNAPLSGVTVSVNNERSVITGKNGYFLFKDIAVTGDRVTIYAQHPTFFKTAKTILIQKGGVYSTRINLVAKNQAVDFPASAGFDNSIGSVKFQIPANALSTQDGAAYAGTCRMSVNHLRADDRNLFRTMPGILMGKNDKGEEKSLASFGMVGVELETPDGKPLEITSGKQVTMSIPIASVQLANAPDEIPLWHLNMESGIWEQEGVAQKIGDRYEGKVGHFSFWNYDLPFDYVKLSAKVRIGGTPSDGYSFSLKTADNFALCAGAYFDANGGFDGNIPVNQVLTLSIYDVCNGLLSEQTIGPFNADTDLGTIELSSSLIDLFHLKAKLVDCNGNPAAYGMLVSDTYLDGGGYLWLNSVADENGNISISTSCLLGAASIQIRFYDALHGQTSTHITIEPSFGAEIDLGEVVVCGDGLEGYFFESQGIPYSQDNVSMSATVDGSVLTIAGYDSIQQEVFYLKVNNNGATGTFPALEKATGWSFSGMNTPANPNNVQGTVTINFFGDAPGKPVTGTFSVGFTDVNGIDQGMGNGRFHAIRQE